MLRVGVELHAPVCFKRRRREMTDLMQEGHLCVCMMEGQLRGQT